MLIIHTIYIYSDIFFLKPYLIVQIKKRLPVTFLTLLVIQKGLL